MSFHKSFTNRFGCICALAIGVALLVTASARADVLPVPGQFQTIQDAIDAAQPGDTVLVADGVYTGEGNRDLDFLGKAITVMSADGPDGCVIDCQGTPEKPHRGFIFQNGESTDSVLDGFTITNGSTMAGAIADIFNGGGVLCADGSPLIKNCVFTNNWAGCWGGAIGCGWFSNNNNPVILDCVFDGNECDAEGGAIFAIDANPVVINCLITNNEATTVGGGICHFGSGNLTIVNTTVVGNTSSWGGGMYSGNQQVVVANSIFWGNTGGGQIDGNAEVTHSIVQGGHIGLGNLDVDPRFVDALGGDFRLTTGSPAIDAGANGFLPVEICSDIDGQARFADDIGTADTGLGDLGHSESLIVDMGPHEFQGVTGVVANLFLISLTRGTDLFGDLDDVRESDDVYKGFRSRRGFTAFEPNLVEFVVGAISDVTDATSLDLAIESHINHPLGVAKLELLSFFDYLFDPVGSHALGFDDQMVVINDLAVGDHVSSDGSMWLNVKHVVMATFTPIGFDSFIDRVAIVVE